MGIKCVAEQDLGYRKQITSTKWSQKIKDELKKLLYDTGSIIERYNNFKNNIKGFGPSSISEILHFVFPEKYCLWNEKPKTVLPIINLDILPDRFFNSQITS